MINILFFGNCQLFAIKQILNLETTYNQEDIECFSTNIDKFTFTTLIRKSDIIITQPISDNYRNKDYLSTYYVLQHMREFCKVFIVDSCHFDYYYFDLTYKTANNTLLEYPSPYHYNGLIECYKANLSAEHFLINYVNNESLKTPEQLDAIANNSLDELRRRNIEHKNKYTHKNIIFITTADFIQQHYKEKLLFYSMNHPTKYLFHFICEQLIHHLSCKNTMNYDIDPMDATRCILYKCIQNNVHFDCNLLLPKLNDKNNINDIVLLYYTDYTTNNYISLL
jgi:hypothetical protein